MPADADAEQIAEVLRYAPGACVVLENGVIRGANAEAVDTTGIPRKRLVGSPLSELIIPETQVPVADFLSSARPEVHAMPVRLAAGMMPLELSARRINDAVIVVGLRRMELEHQLSAIAGGDLTHDQITGLPNRFHLLEQLHHRLTTQSPQPLAVIALWIDDLPNLAAERGQRVVERVSRQVGERVQARLRGPDLLGRFDDAAFLALLTTDSPPEQLREIAERLRDEVVFPVEFDGSLISFTASVMVGMIGTNRPTIDKIQSRLEVVGRLTATGDGNRTEMVTF
ncbi:MAG: diguanylate cyclase [Acidimicrobiales bacterium]